MMNDESKRQKAKGKNSKVKVHSDAIHRIVNKEKQE